MNKWYRTSWIGRFLSVLAIVSLLHVPILTVGAPLAFAASNDGTGMSMTSCEATDIAL